MGLFDLLIGPKSIFSRYTVSQETEEKVRAEWVKIATLRKLGGPSNLRQALISADKCLDNVLKDITKGESMGERLKMVKDKFERSFYNRLWEAHKVRNNLVHEAGYEPPYYVVNESLDTLKQAVEMLGVRL